jgi:[ribosomal protein S18]-alanine N-acetyltransferase
MRGLIARLFGGRPPTVEPAVLADARRLARLHGASFHRGWGTAEFEQLLIDRNVLTHRLCQNHQIIGFAVSRRAADEAEILSVAIDPRHRGRGLSRALLLSHLGHLAGHGVARVFLEVEENNQPARRLYERAGFSVVGRRERYYRDAAGQALNALVMRRDLS